MATAPAPATSDPDPDPNAGRRTALRVGSAGRFGPLTQVDPEPAHLKPGLRALSELAAPAEADRVATIGRPWDLLIHQAEAIAADVAGLRSQTPLPPHTVVLGDHAVTLGEGVEVQPHTVLDARRGPIHLGDHSTAGPCAVLEGPIATGPHCVISPQSHLRGPVTLGRHTKVGGELKGCIVGDYSNKAHYGYLGDAIVGRWCNLGAGTTVSNLKNTYGEVRVALDMAAPGGGTPEPTGRQFQGPILGDFVRTAIGTRLLTGSVVGAGACLAISGFAPKFVPAMRFLTDAGDAPMDPDAFFATLTRMLDRRGLTVDDALRARLAALM